MTLPANYRQRVSDWQILSRGNLSGGAGVSAGVWHFAFKSRTLNSAEDYYMVAVGAGARVGLQGRGGAVSDAAAAIGNAATGGYTPINCQQPFSFADITNGAANLIEIGAAVGIGFSVAKLSLNASLQGPTNGRLFSNLEMKGLALGGWWWSWRLRGHNACWTSPSGCFQSRL